MPDLDLNLVLAVVFGIFVLYFLGKVLVNPARILLRAVISTITGAIILFLFNFFAGFINLSVGINAVTALIVGFLGIPGLMMILLLQIILG